MEYKIVKFNQPQGNEIVVEFIPENDSVYEHILVTDKHCLLRRYYEIGKLGELVQDEKMLVESFEQVVEAWKTEQVWF